MKSNYLYSILTVCTGNYEPIREVENPSDTVEYVCVTDNPDLLSKTWKLIYIPNIWFLYVKHHLYEFVSTNVCLWLDGSYQILNDCTEAFVKPFIDSNKEMSIFIHDKRHSVLEEILYWIYTRNFNVNNGERFIKTVINNRFQQDTLFQTSCMLTKKTNDVLNIFYLVDQLEKYCSIEENYRDDLTIISYIIGTYYYRWDKLNIMNFEKICLNKYFSWKQHGNEINMLEYQKSFRCFDKDFDHLYEIGDDFNRNFFE